MTVATDEPPTSAEVSKISLRTSTMVKLYKHCLVVGILVG